MRRTTTLHDIRGYDLAKPADPQQLLERLKQKAQRDALELTFFGSTVFLVLGILFGLVLSKFIG